MTEGGHSGGKANSQLTSGFQSAKIPAGLSWSTHTCSAQMSCENLRGQKAPAMPDNNAVRCRSFM